MEFVLLLIVLLGILIGLWIAWLARDELYAGRKWFVALGAVALIAGIVLIALGEAAGATTCFFILAMALVAWRKSHDKRWTRFR